MKKSRKVKQDNMSETEDYESSSGSENSDSEEYSESESESEEVYEAENEVEYQMSKPMYEDTVFEATTTQGRAFRIVQEPLKDLIGDGSFVVGPAGISLVVIDSSRTVYVDLNLPSDKFDHFYYMEENPVSIGLSIKNLHTILKNIGNNNKTTLQIYMFLSDVSKVKIRFDNPDKGQINEYELPVLDLAHDAINMKDLVYPFGIQMPCDDLKKICQDIKNMGGTKINLMVNVDGNGDPKLICSNGNDTQIGKCKITRIPGKNKGIIIKMLDSCDNDEDDEDNNDENKELTKLPAYVTYNSTCLLERIMSFTKCTSLCDNVSLMMNEDGPTTFKYDVANLGTIKFCINSLSDDPPI